MAWLRREALRRGRERIVVGLSGGIDSALVIRLCQAAAPGHVVGVIMPCHSDPRDEADAAIVAREFDVPSIRIDLEPAYDRLTETLNASLSTLPPSIERAPVDDATDIKARVPLANVKPRLRMTSLYSWRTRSTTSWRAPATAAS